MSVGSAPPAGAVLYAVDPRRVGMFYAAVTALEIAREASDHIVLESPGQQLVIVKIPDAIAATIAIDEPPVRRTDTPVKLAFPVASIDAARAAAARLGGALDAPERTWEFDGARVCDAHDPEGNVFQVRERIAANGLTPAADAGPAAEDVVREFWRLMATNEFDRVAAVLAADFVLDWPQSGERIRGAEAFALMNREYPAQGPWQFTINRIVAGAAEVSSDVSVTDGVTTGRALSFFTIANGRIARLVEFWPEPFPAPPNRAHLVERLQ